MDNLVLMQILTAPTTLWQRQARASLSRQNSLRGGKGSHLQGAKPNQLVTPVRAVSKDLDRIFSIRITRGQKFAGQIYDIENWC